MTDQSPKETPAKNAFSLVLIALMKGVLHAESDPAQWQALLELQARVRDHVTPLGLELLLDASAGYAYLRQRPSTEGEPELPRLVPRRQLGYQVSLVLALLRKKLAELDAQGDATRLILDREQIADMVRVFLPEAANEVRLMDRLDAHLNKIVEMGFLRRLRAKDDQFEVRRILKAFVDGQWLGEFDRRLTDYVAHASADSADKADS
jgi:hypothetical protein